MRVGVAGFAWGSGSFAGLPRPLRGLAMTGVYGRGVRHDGGLWAWACNDAVFPASRGAGEPDLLEGVAGRAFALLPGPRLELRAPLVDGEGVAGVAHVIAEAGVEEVFAGVEVAEGFDLTVSQAPMKWTGHSRADDAVMISGCGVGVVRVGASLLAQGVLRTLCSRASSLPPEQRVTLRSVGPSLVWHAPGPNGLLGNHRVMFEQSVRTRFKSRANAGPAGVPGSLRQVDHDDAGNAALQAEPRASTSSSGIPAESSATDATFHPAARSASTKGAGMFSSASSGGRLIRGQSPPRPGNRPQKPRLRECRQR